VRASLLQLMQQEVRRTFERALGSSSESLLDSVLKRTGSAAEPRYQGGHGGMPEDGEPTPQYRPALRQAMDPDAMLAHRKPSSALLEREEPTLYRGTSRPGTAALAEPQPEAVIQALAVVEALDKGTARPEASGPSAEDEVYEGNVRLSVQATGGMREVVHFVDGLREKPHFRLFQLVGSRKEAADILLGLREPMPLKRLLRQMPGVSQVAAPAGRSPAGVEPLISVRLGDASASALLS
ncbi:MAG: hypothetical protein HYX99_00320, partial [Chloroflexi bacterium]|nr:hypothetical protein [Chloroflexota bacterium]